MEDDVTVQAEVDKWIRDNNEFASKGAGAKPEDLNRRIKEKFAPIARSTKTMNTIQTTRVGG